MFEDEKKCAVTIDCRKDELALVTNKKNASRIKFTGEFSTTESSIFGDSVKIFASCLLLYMVTDLHFDKDIREHHGIYFLRALFDFLNERKFAIS